MFKHGAEINITTTCPECCETIKDGYCPKCGVKFIYKEDKDEKQDSQGTDKKTD